MTAAEVMNPIEESRGGYRQQIRWQRLSSFQNYVRDSSWSQATVAGDEGRDWREEFIRYCEVLEQIDDQRCRCQAILQIQEEQHISQSDNPNKTSSSLANQDPSMANPNHPHTQENGLRRHHEEQSQQVAVVMVPLPAQGHLNQLLHLSRLVSAANLPVYYLGSATHIRQAKLRVHGWDLSATGAAVTFHELPTPHFDNPLPDPNTSIKFPSQLIPAFSASKNLRGPFFEFVKNISTKFRRVVVIHDGLMSYVVQDIDSVQNAESYCFRAISAFTLYLLLREFAGKPELPGEPDILKEIPGPEGFSTPEFLEFARSQFGSKRLYSGEIYNTSRVIESVYLDLHAKHKMSGVDKIWAVGPFNPVEIFRKQGPNLEPHHKCLEWLDKQGPDSVIFVSFGTTCSLSDEQIKELAIGLEKSQQKFIWVLRDADKSDIFTGDVRKAKLPEGFEERVRDRGMIVRDWAPQLEILSHSSTGGFMSHCGWNSCMESISMGVPIATWPMHSDQPRNAFLVNRVLRIGVEVKDWERRDELVSSETVMDSVGKLMGSGEGDVIRARAKELGVAVRGSLTEGGSSRKEMESFIAHITR